MLEHIDHINIVVRDLPTMLAFYRDALGLPIDKDVMIEGDWIENVVGLKGVRARVIYLSLPTGPRIELIEYQSPRPIDLSQLEQPHAAGIRHMAFRVTDIDAAYEKLSSAGVTFVGKPQLVSSDQVQYAGGVRKRLAYFHDPEGNLLELCEYK